MPELWLWSGPPESSYWFSFASAFNLFLAVKSSSLFHLCICLVLMFSEMLHWWEVLCAGWTNVLCILRQNWGRGLWPHRVGLSAADIFYWPFQGVAPAVVYYFCHFMSLHVCLGEKIILDSRLANVWERNCPSGFLLVMVWLWCRCFKCVFFSPWCLGTEILGNCILV